MKNSLQSNPLMFKIVVLITCFMLVMVYNKSQAATIKKNITTSKQVVVKK